MTSVHTFPDYPGAPTIIKKLLNFQLSNFYLPCVWSTHARNYYDTLGNALPDLETNAFESLEPEPYSSIGSNTFSVVDPNEADAFFFNFLNLREAYSHVRDRNLVAYKTRLQNVPQMNERIEREICKLRVGNYVMDPESLEQTEIESRFAHGFHMTGSNPDSVFVHKVSDIPVDVFSKKTNLVYHHTAHTYVNWTEYENNDLLSILEASSDLACFQLCNLHSLDATKLAEALKKFDSDELYFVQLIPEDWGECHLEIASFNDVDFKNRKTGNYKWLFIRNEQ